METKKLSELCLITKGKKVSIIDQRTRNSIPYLLINTLRGIEAKTFTEDKKYTEAIPSDILIVCDGANSGLVGTGLSGATGSTIARLRMNNFSEINKDYFMHFLKSNFEKMNLDIKGAAIPHLKQKEMLDMEIWLPKLPLQKKIVAEIEKQFSRLDESEKELKETGRKLSLYKKAVLKEAFRMRDDWEEKELGELIQTIDGDRGKNYPNKSEFSKEGYCLFLSTKNVRQNGFSFNDNIFITKDKDDILRGGKLKKGDVIITTRGTLGNIAIYDDSVPFENIRINSGMLILRIKDSILVDSFLCKFLTSPFFTNQVEKNRSGTAQPQIPAGVVRKLKLSFPSSKEEQQKIVSEIEERFSVVGVVEREVRGSLGKVDRLRKSILKSAFEGKLVKEKGINN